MSVWLGMRFLLCIVKAGEIIYLLHQVLAPFSKALKIHNVFSKKFWKISSLISVRKTLMCKKNKQIHAELNLCLSKNGDLVIKACRKLPSSILFLLKRILACCAFSLVCGGDPCRALAWLSHLYFLTDLEEPAADFAACCFPLLESLSCYLDFWNRITGLLQMKWHFWRSSSSLCVCFPDLTGQLTSNVLWKEA